MAKIDHYEFCEVKLDNLLNGEKVETKVWRFIAYSDSRDTCIFMKRLKTQKQ